MPNIRNDGIDARHQRIKAVKEAIMKLLNNNNGSYPLDKAHAIVEDQTGLTLRKFLEYASNGEKLGMYEIDQKNNLIKRAAPENER